MYQTDQYEGMIAETVTMRGHKGDVINAYMARPFGTGPFPGMIVIHHAPGWDEWYRECTRRFAHHGFVSLSPNLYFRDGHGTPEDVGAKVRAAGGAPDEQVLGDLDGANQVLRSLPYVSGKIGIFGTCSGGRQAFLAACRLKGLDAAIDCWGGGITADSAPPSEQRPTPIVDLVPRLCCPLYAVCGQEDANPSPAQVEVLRKRLQDAGKTFTIDMFKNAGHAFFADYRPSYREKAAFELWPKMAAFFANHLKGKK